MRLYWKKVCRYPDFKQMRQNVAEDIRTIQAICWSNRKKPFDLKALSEIAEGRSATAGRVTAIVIGRWYPMEEP